MLKKLAGQTAVYGLSTMLSKFLSYMLTPYLSRVISNVNYGTITELYALIPFAMVLLTMGLETGYFRFAGQTKDEGERRAIFASIWGAICLASVALLGLSFIFVAPISELMKYGANPEYILLVAGIIAIDAISAAPFARLRQLGRSGKYMQLRLLSVVINIILTVGFLTLLPHLANKFGGAWVGYWNPDFAAGYVLLSNLVASVITLLLIIPTCDRIRPRTSWKVLRPILIYSLPLLIAGIPGIANEYIDRVIMKYLIGDENGLALVGTFGAISKIGVILVLFTQMYRLAAEPFFLTGFKKEEFKEMNAAAMKYFIIISIGIFLFVWFFKEIFALIVDRQYRWAMYILPIIMLSNILSGVVLNLSFWYKSTGATKMAIYVTGIGLLFTIVFNILLVPKMGIVGAAIARLICEVMMVIISYLIGRKCYPVPYDLRRIGEYALLGIVLFGSTQITGELPAVGRYIVNALLLASFGIFAARREKIDVIGIVKSAIRRS